VAGAGFVAVKAAAMAPGRVASLTLLGTTRHGWHNAASLAEARARARPARLPTPRCRAHAPGRCWLPCGSGNFVQFFPGLQSFALSWADRHGPGQAAQRKGARQRRGWPGAERQAGVFPMSRRKIAAYLRVNFSPGFLAQRVGGRPRRDALVAGTWRAHTAILRSSCAWRIRREGRTGV